MNKQDRDRIENKIVNIALAMVVAGIGAALAFGVSGDRWLAMGFFIVIYAAVAYFLSKTINP